MVNSREMAAHRERGYMTNATLKFGDKELELPMMSPSAGPDVIDIQKLYGQGGVFTYDPGFTSTASIPTSRHGASWINARACREDTPPGTGCDTPGAYAGSNASRSTVR